MSLCVRSWISPVREIRQEATANLKEAVELFLKPPLPAVPSSRPRQGRRRRNAVMTLSR